MLNIRKAPYTEDLVAQRQKAIHGSRYVHLRGVDPAFNNCSIPIEILIDKVQGSIAFSMLLEDITPLDKNKDTLYTSFNLNNLSPNEPTINYIEDYLDVCEFRDAEGNDTYIKEYFMRRHIALFYSCGSIIDDMCYAEELKAELRKEFFEVKKEYCAVSNIKEKIEEFQKKDINDYYSIEKNLKDTLDKIITFADDIGTKLKDYYQENKEEIEQVSNNFNKEKEENKIKEEDDSKQSFSKAFVFDILKYQLNFSDEYIKELLKRPLANIFSGVYDCPYNSRMKLDNDCFQREEEIGLFPSYFYQKDIVCGLKCPKFNKK